jgi:predicted phage terminase large subunit-like protein
MTGGVRRPRSSLRATDASDYVVGQVWAKRGADSYLVYQVWSRLSFTDTIAAIRRVMRLFPQSRRKIIEAKANGDAVIDSLRHEIPGIIEAHPYTSKAARATAVSPFVRAGNVHIPSGHAASMAPEIAWDPESFVLECTAFPNGAHDDQVDACSQYLHEAYLVGGTVTLLVPESRMAPRHANTRALSPLRQRLHDLQRRSSSQGGRV